MTFPPSFIKEINLSNKRYNKKRANHCSLFISDLIASNPQGLHFILDKGSLKRPYEIKAKRRSTSEEQTHLRLKKRPLHTNLTKHILNIFFP